MVGEFKGITPKAAETAPERNMIAKPKEFFMTLYSPAITHPVARKMKSIPRQKATPTVFRPLWLLQNPEKIGRNSASCRTSSRAGISPQAAIWWLYKIPSFILATSVILGFMPQLGVVRIMMIRTLAVPVSAVGCAN